MVGMYYPIQGMLRGTLISNEHRATVSFRKLIFVAQALIILAALRSLPSSTERFRRGLALDRRLVRPLCGHDRKRADAC